MSVGSKVEFPLYFSANFLFCTPLTLKASEQNLALGEVNQEGDFWEAYCLHKDSLFLPTLM